ncbi:Uncharacterised protein [Mycobacterium tuberculosis]|uniref:Uncharacterized protein n=1 Tax=Mycobacterium tuberculosis TaxID=1773 RepID=A0A654U2Q2_MYCTX|nr:Uncharacterised protein [Mycobacterium tuberculosis]CKR49391.1 Uncharacterised protein [Mycobacterium tuberculosis]
MTPAPSSAAPPSSEPRMPPAPNAASMIASLEKKPANGGTPIIARYARPKVANVTGRAARRPP